MSKICSALPGESTEAVALRQGVPEDEEDEDEQAEDEEVGEGGDDEGEGYSE